MGSSGNSSPADLPRRVAAEIAPAIFPGAHLALGLSGGMDSVVLLSLLVELAPALKFSLRAVHVNHGISPNAGRWADFCARLCAKSQVPMQLESVDIAPYRDLGLEGAARQARYEAFARVDADFIVLAQHRDDQAETLLLRLLRGAGPRGLASMPSSRPLAGAPARLLRPLLGIARKEIEAYAVTHGLEWVEDESNADTLRRRNFLRHDVLPLLERQFPAASASIARAAAHLAEARDLLDAVAESDLEGCGLPGLEVAVLRRLELARAKNLLRYWCEMRGVQPLSSAQITELLRQALEARPDSRVSLATRDWVFSRYRDALYVERAVSAVARDFIATWSGENAMPLLALGGVLKFKPEEGRGLSLAKLRSEPVTVRVRKGGERMHLDGRRPRRTLKNLFQERGVPPWQRDRLPLVFSGEHLVAVPGIGEAWEFRAAAGEAGLIVTWEPLATRDTPAKG